MVLAAWVTVITGVVSLFQLIIKVEAPWFYITLTIFLVAGILSTTFTLIKLRSERIKHKRLIDSENSQKKKLDSEIEVLREDVDREKLKLEMATYDLHSGIVHMICDECAGIFEDKEINGFISTLKHLVKNSSELLSDICQKNVSVCVKGIIKTKDDLLNCNTITLARFCPNDSDLATRLKTDRERENNLPRINEDTDFEAIVAEKNDYFVCGDLHKLNTYSNSSNNFKLGLYKSAMTIPIRAVLPETSNDGKIYYDIIGFFCLDSDETSFEWEVPRNSVLNIASTIADILYIYMKSRLGWKSERVKDNEVNLPVHIN